MCLVRFSSFTAKPRGRDYLRFLYLLFVYDSQEVKASVASNIKLHITLVILDLNRFDILPPDCEQKVLEFLNFADVTRGGTQGEDSYRPRVTLFTRVFKKNPEALL